MRSSPIKSLKSLNEWEENESNSMNISKIKLHGGKKSIQKVLLCHDMDNNYKQDAEIQGSKTKSYYFKYWKYIDIFTCIYIIKNRF